MTTLIDTNRTTFKWEDRAGQPVRPFVDGTWTVGAVEVALEGLETLAGATREVVVNGEPLTAEQVRDLAAVLSALADDLP